MNKMKMAHLILSKIKFLKMKHTIYILFLIVFWHKDVVIAQQGPNAKINRYELKHAFFNKEIYARNFIWVNKKYLSDSLSRKLEKVAFYNEIAQEIDSTSSIRPFFTFKGDSVIHVQFYQKNKTIDIVDDTSKKRFFYFLWQSHSC